MALVVAVRDIVAQSDNEILGIHASWERVELGKIATIQNGFPFKSELFSTDKSGMPLIRIRDVGEDASDTYYKGEYPDNFVVNAGDLLIGMDGDFKSAIWNGPAALLNQRVCRILLNTDLYDFKFLHYALPGYLLAIHKVTSAVTVKHLSSKSIAEIPLPLPPLPEQRRIVAKLEELFSRLDAGVAAVRQSQQLLKRYRQSVLHAAVTGALTSAWRTAHPAPEESGAALLARIRAERRALWEAAQQAKRGGQLPLNGAWKNKYEEPAAVDTSELPELPEGWVWASLPEVGELNRGKSKHRPRDDKQLYGGPYPFIQTGDVRHANGVIKKYSQTYSELGLQQSRLWPTGTLCITIAANIADTALLNFDACFPDSVVGFLTDDSHCNIKFIELFIRTAKENIERYAPATAQKNINLEILSKVGIPIPPLDEQTAIVAEAERYLSTIDSLELTLAAELKRAERLRQSLLHRAFTGRLAPQDATDEPAGELLARLQSAAPGPAKAKTSRAKAAVAPVAGEEGEGKRRGRPRKAEAVEDVAEVVEVPLPAGTQTTLGF